MTTARFVSRRLMRMMCASWIVTLASASPVVAQDDAFRAGLDARADKKWRDVTVQMRRAIQANAEESTRKVRSRLGGLLRQGGTEYLPHFFLGEALFNLEDCVGAIDAWSTSERQGAIRSRADLVAIVQDGYAACDAKGVLPPARYDPLLTRTTQHINEVNGQAEAVVKLGTANLDLWQSEAREQYEKASTEIQNARAGFEGAVKSRSLSEFNAANSAADRARSILVGLEANLRTAVAARLSVQREARDIEQMLVTAEGMDRLIETKKSMLTGAFVNARTEARDALTRARDRLAAAIKASSPAMLGESRAFAADGTAKLKRVIDAIATVEKESSRRQFVDASAQAEQTFAIVDNALVKLDRLALERPAVMDRDQRAERDALHREVAAVRRRFDAARRNDNTGSIVEVNRAASDAADRLNRLLAIFGPVLLTDRIPAALVQGSRLFFAGEYSKALAALHPSGGFPSEVPLRVHIHLFRAAALYALFVRSHESDEGLRAQALAEVAECRRIAPAFQPDPRAFAPPFIRFFQSGAVTPSQARGDAAVRR